MNSKRNIFIQHDGMRMNPDFLSPEWKDDEINMSDNQSSDDNTIDYKKASFDANNIDQFEDLEEIPVHDYRGKTISYRSEFLRKIRREHYINNK